MKLLGIDEAGRGAVLGPLVVAALLLDEKQLPLLKALGVKDSKKLSPRRREEIFNKLKGRKVKFHFFEISPRKIDSKSINELEIETACKFIEKLKPQKVFLDVPAQGKGIDNYCNAIRTKLRKEVEVVGGNKFDSTQPVVAAASIVAKIMRERAITRLKRKYGDFGSGYPNERTVAYLQANYERSKPIVRMKWRTIENLKLKKEKLH